MLCHCSRVADLLATFSIGTQSERHPEGTTGSKDTEVGNPDIRIPENLPMKDGPEAQNVEEAEAEAAGVGNPDIRVPESFKSEEGLHARQAEEGKDAERKDTGNTNKGDSGENEKRLDPYLEVKGTPIS
ncbi:hypothetical protein NDU88_005662 [Pleurodeles waltl]|uniref:Uncharacterized protein n=1 Tax=Pleurodeles waltl TaxID=8319 RepID=A0AAV7WC53_PLEWA|nr:hypothetical protein NDU88_005662 [Pleurodeles waltl]